jgi:hypothetical protein
LAIDAAGRLEVIAKIQSHDDPYTEKEKKILQSGVDIVMLFEGVSSKAFKWAGQSPTTKAKIAYKRGDHLAYGWATATVRASAEQVLAWVWDQNSRAMVREDNLEKSIDDAPNRHNQLLYMRKKTVSAIADRDFLGRSLWMRTRNGYIVVTNAEESDRRGPVDDTVRGKYPSTLRIVREGDSESRLECVRERERVSGACVLLRLLSASTTPLFSHPIFALAQVRDQPGLRRHPGLRHEDVPRLQPCVRDGNPRVLPEVART